MFGRRGVTVTLTVLGVIALTGVSGSAGPPAGPYRAFSSDSYWNTPLPADAPTDPHSTDYLSYMTSTAVNPFLSLSGLGSDYPAWGKPIYWAHDDDPVYRIRNTCDWWQPPVFRHVRIPRGARPAPDSDAEMTVYDLDAGIEIDLWHARYDAASDTWSACGGERYGLDSNGLHVDTHQSDDPQNWGHRGVPAPTQAIRLDEVQAGRIDHVLEFGTRFPSGQHVFPMVGSDGQGTAAWAPPQGLRMRIRPDLDLTTLGLSPAALVVARALQTYGAVLGDSSGGPTAIKVENCSVEGRGDCWHGRLGSFSLKGIPMSDYEVIRLGWDPNAG
jgi:hypothetical protein